MTVESNSNTPLPLTESEERTWAMIAHLSILLNLVSGFLGILAVLLIYLIQKDRSKYVAYQSLQSLIFQLITWAGGGLLIAGVWIVVSVLSALIVGICLVPFAFLISLIPIAAVVYGVIGGIDCNNHKDFKYWLIGDWVRGTYENIEQ